MVVYSFYPIATLVYLSKIFHSDHYQGIERAGTIYASKETCLVMKNKGFSVECCVLEIYKPHVFVVDGETVEIELIPSNHCVGSTMFLIKGSKGNVLYTGDMRADENLVDQFLSRYKIPLKSLYIDCTFYNDNFNVIPSIAQSCDVFLEEYAHVNKSVNFYAKFIGYEPLFQAVFSRYREKVHVNKEKYDQYKGIEEILECLTLDKGSTFRSCNCCLADLVIRPCCQYFGRYKCETLYEAYSPTYHVRTITPFY
jgi:hypothetical protein